jgi:hypothetical protein
VSYCRSVHIKERLRLINKQEDRKAERHFFYLRHFFLFENFLSPTCNDGLRLLFMPFLGNQAASRLSKFYII